MLATTDLKNHLHLDHIQPSDVLLLCVATNNSSPKSVSAIKEMAVGAGYRKITKWNVSDRLRKMRGLVILTPDGWELTASGGNATQKLLGVAPADSPVRELTVLVLAANPQATTSLRLNEEVRSIVERIRATDHRAKVKVESEWAVRVKDVQSAILRFNPDILHISGHGCPNGEIVLEDDGGGSKTIQLSALGKVLSAVGENVKFVLLNTCYSAVNAQRLANAVKVEVVAMNNSIPDDSAIAFASAFYQALAFGKDATTAFQSGKAEIALLGADDSIVELFKHGANHTR